MTRLARWRKVAALESAERRILLEAAALTAMFAVALRALPLRTVLRFGSRSAGRGRQDRVSIARIATLVDGMGREVGATCLMRALALGRVLSARGIPHEIHLGARRAGRGMAGHAWVSHDGRVLIGGGGREAYEPLLVLSRSAS